MDKETAVFSGKLSGLIKTAKENKSTLTYKEIEDYFHDVSLNSWK